MVSRQILGPSRLLPFECTNFLRCPSNSGDPGWFPGAFGAKSTKLRFAHNPDSRTNNPSSYSSIHSSLTQPVVLVQSQRRMHISPKSDSQRECAGERIARWWEHCAVIAFWAVAKWNGCFLWTCSRVPREFLAGICIAFFPCPTVGTVAWAWVFRHQPSVLNLKI